MRRNLASLLLGILLAGPVPETPAEPSWIERSNVNARLMLDVQVRFSPEDAGRLGVEGLDEAVTTLPLDRSTQESRAWAAAVAELRRRLGDEKDPSVRQNLEILIDAGERYGELPRLQEKYFLPVVNPSQMVFQGIRALLDGTVTKERRQAALVRLRKYAGSEPGSTPLAVQAGALLRTRLGDPKLLAPFRDELERQLNNSSRFAEGTAALFREHGLTGWEEPYARLKEQLAAYDALLRAEVLPRAREDFRLPEEVYRFNLRQRGIDMSLEELVSRAKTSFREIQNEMQTVAALVAKERQLSSSDYRDVIRALKREQLTGEAILPHYQKRVADLERLIREAGVVSLPKRPMRVRLASEAESAAVPMAHIETPRLLGEDLESPDFVLPLRIPGKAGEGEVGFDDFTFEAASWTLTAHEGRPGHELQYNAIIDSGMSMARVIYAFNSVNVEGWALYGEAEMKPLLPLDGQLIALQHRLLRAARAFLDPGLQTGDITREEAFRVLEEDGVFSHAMALQEVERYTFRSVGQAPSYFVGYSRFMELRADAERLLGRRFDRRAYHDFILAQGLLSPALLRKAVMERFVPAQRNGRARSEGRLPAPGTPPAGSPRRASAAP